jgi:outer membrane protein TolC
VLEPVDWAEPAEAALPEHPALSAAREARAAARSDLSSARLERAVTAEVGATAAEYNIGDGFGFGWSASVGLDAPILSSGALQQSARAAEDRLAIADAELADQKNQLEIALVSAEAQLAASRAGLVAREAALEAAQAALDLEEARYREGLSGATDWLVVRRQRDQTAAALAGARAGLGEALAGVEAARGVW